MPHVNLTRVKGLPSAIPTPVMGRKQKKRKTKKKEAKK